MPIFARRRLQAMLDDLAPRLTSAKAADLHGRLEHDDTKTALAAEIELALLWGVGQVADLTVEPTLSSGRRPDLHSSNLFASRPAFVEITAISDDTFSGAEDMDRAANIVVGLVDRVRKGASAHLHFEFLETHGYDASGYYRRRRVTSDFKLTQALENVLRGWLTGPNWPAPNPLRLTDEQIDVVIHWKSFVHPKFRTFSSMPAVAYDLENNHLFKALRKKERRLSAVPPGTLKCILLGDVGCRILRELRPMSITEVNGDQIIRHFLRRSDVDVIGIVSAHHSSSVMMPAFNSPVWTVNVYDRCAPLAEPEYTRLNALPAALPRPHLEGYQARVLHRQGAFHPQARGRYLGMTIASRRGSATMKISARLLQDFLAGRITREQFQFAAFGNNKNLFEHWLQMGFTLQDARVEKAGTDEDDDYLVFDFGPDVAAMPLKMPETAS
jgi:hypothetical protein